MGSTRPIAHLALLALDSSNLSFPAMVSFSRLLSTLPFTTRLIPLRRTHRIPSRRLISFQAKHAESGLDGPVNQRTISPSLLTAEKEEAKAVLTLFLKKHGLSTSIAARVINKSDAFIDHLVSRLHSVHKFRYLVGRELTTLEIRDALIPYLETLHEEYGKNLVDMVENYPNSPSIEEGSVQTVPSPPAKDSAVPVLSPSTGVLDTKKRRALARVSEIGPSGTLPAHITYLVELGMELDAIKDVIRKFPAFSYYTLEGKIKPVVEFLLDLGVSKSDIPTIISKRPQLCGISLSENIIPTMTFLENLGVDKTQWAKVICRFPALLTYSHQKLRTTVDFLYETGLSAESVGKIITRCPNIISYSVEDNLRPTAAYFRSLGVDVAVLLQRAPQAFGLSIETNLKPATAFFLERGYSMGEVSTMMSRYGALYTFNLAENLVPKWEFFLTMEYPKSELVKFPQYFGYSLNDRIKPRYAIVRENGVRLLLNQVLSLSDAEFKKALNRKISKNLTSSGDSRNFSQQ